MELSEQELVRREKLQRIKDLGINPYPAEMFPVSIYSSEKKLLLLVVLCPEEYKEMQVLQKFKIIQEKYKFILIEMKYVQELINFYTTNFTKNYLILVI